MQAKNFDDHEHDAFNVHLLVVLHAPWHYRYHKGIPVISLYRRPAGGDRFLYSLVDDIGCLYHSRESVLFPGTTYKIKGDNDHEQDD